MSGAAPEILGVEASKGFFIFMIIVTGIITGVLIANAIYFSRLEDKNGGQVTTEGSAQFLKWANIIMAIVAATAFLWCIYRLLVSSSAREALGKSLTTAPTGVINYNPTTGQYSLSGVTAPLAAAPQAPPLRAPALAPPTLPAAAQRPLVPSV